MPELPEIAALAKTVSDELAATEDLARRAQAGHVYWPLPSAARRMEHFGTPGVLGALELIREHNPTHILADVAARRTLLDEALGWEHAPVEEGRRYYPCQVEADPPGLCDCKRDEHVLAVLMCLAKPYQGQP